MNIRNCSILIATIDSYRSEAMLTVSRMAALGINRICPVYVAVGPDSSDLAAIEGVTLIRRTRVGSWSSELKEALDLLTSEYVLLWLDDFVPVSCDGERMQRLMEWALSERVDYLRLNPTPPGRGERVAPGIDRISLRAPYRTSTQICVWRKRALAELLSDDETAWQFELNGSARSDGMVGFFASSQWTVRCENLVVKGLVDRRAEKALNDRGISTSGIHRRRMTASELKRLRVNEFRSAIFRLLPERIQRSLRPRFDTNLKTIKDCGAGS